MIKIKTKRQGALSHTLPGGSRLDSDQQGIGRFCSGHLSVSQALLVRAKPSLS